MTRHCWPLPLLFAALLLPIAGCSSDPREGYSTRSVFPDQIRTIAVPIFQNDTFDRDIEFHLTAALIRSIESRTPYRAAGREQADSILMGQITKVELDPLSTSTTTGLGEEVVVRVTIDFQWRMLDLDRTLVERKSFSGHGLFTPSQPASERIELGRFSAVQQLADDIVDEMQAAW